MKHALLLVALLALVPDTSLAALSPAQVAKRGLAGVVVVRVEKKGSSPKEASGFFVDKGVVCTLASLVEGAEQVKVRLATSEEWLDIGPVVARDKHNDIILLELKHKSGPRPLSLAREDPSIGATVYAVAAPPKTKGVFHRGLVSGVVENAGRTFVQMDAYVPAGAEGGALLDESGEVVGLLIASQEGARFSYAVPASLVKALKDAPKAKDPLAGVSMGAAAAWEKGARAERDKRWADAEAAFAEALRLEPKMTKAEKHVARALAGQDKLPEAAALFVAYLDKEPKDHDALFELAEVQRKRGRMAEAFDLFTAYTRAEQRQARKAYTDHAKRVLGQLTRAFERRLALLTLTDESGAASGGKTQAEVSKQLTRRLDAKSKLELVDAATVPLDALPKNDGSCRAKASCVWKPAWSRWILAGKLVPPPDGVTVAVDLELFDVRARKRIATAEVRSQGGNVLPLDIDDGLAALLTDLPAELAGTLRRGKGGSGRRPLRLDDESAPPESGGAFEDEGQPLASSSSGGLASSASDSASEGSADDAGRESDAGGDVVEGEASASSSSGSSGGDEGASTSSSASARRSLRDLDEPPVRDTRRIARVERQASGSIPIVPWLLITGGVAVAGAGLAFDLFSPSSANYDIGALDFVGPAVMGVGAAAVIGGIVMGPFGGDDEER